VSQASIPARTAVVPMLAYEDAAAAIEWLTAAFGFREEAGSRYSDADGRVGHVQLNIGDGAIFLASPTPDYRNPRHHAESCEEARRWLSVPWVIDGVQVEVDDVDSHRAQAVAAGAHMLSEIEDNPYGRLYRAEDLEGHRWMFIQPSHGGS
jgi:PhnB protein